MLRLVKKGASIKVIEAELKKFKQKKGFNANKYNGTINILNTPLLIQKQMRDEWQ